MLNDASCFRLTGYGGLVNLVQPLEARRTIDVVPATAMADHVCVPVALDGDTHEPDAFASPTDIVEFVFITRYADER